MESEEVRRKPNTEQPSRREPPAADKPAETGHYDILILGRSGLGKSSTADKLMVPNSLEPTKQEQEPADQQPIVSRQEPADKQQTVPCSEGAVDTTDTTSDSPEISPVDESANVRYENLTAWVLFEETTEQELKDVEEQENLQEYENAQKRMKNIVFCRTSHEISHTDIDRLRHDKENEEIYKSSTNCQLLTNDDSKVRALDTPGFYSPEHYGGATTTADSNLAILRQIIRIQAIAGLRFRRILYFLPCLQRSDRVMQDEIKQMVKFFGRSIFTCMVLVGIMNRHVSKSTKMTSEEKFPKKQLAENMKLFQEALEREFKERKEDATNLPQPPIIFIAMTDTCEQILQAVRSAPVENDNGLQLEFNSDTCCRCSIEFVEKEDKKLMCSYRSKNADPWADAIPYDESLCHPLMLPKYTLRSIRQGIAGIFRGKWCFKEEKCIGCKLGPGSQGCKKVYSKYEEEGYEPILVDHTHQLDKHSKRKKMKAKE